MGHIHTSFGLNHCASLMLRPQISVVASEGVLQSLRAVAGSRFPGELRLVLSGNGEAVADEVIAEAGLLVIEAAPGNPASFGRVAQIRRQRPDLPLIVALHEPSIEAVRTLLRLGVGDVVDLPFVMDDLADSMVELLAYSSRNAAALVPLAPLVPVIRSTGGSGATTVITHLATALASRSNSSLPACVIDLDIQSGNIGSLIGRDLRFNVMELLQAGGRLDTALLHGVAMDAGHGFDVIAAPDEIMPLELLDAGSVVKLINTARQDYGSVLVDLPADWTNWALSVLLEATDIILVTDLSVASLRQAKRKLELFASVGVPSERLRIVVNRFERRMFPTITKGKVRDVLGHEIFATLSSEPALLQKAQDQGLLASDLNPRSQFAQDVVAMADRLADNWVL